MKIIDFKYKVIETPLKSPYDLSYVKLTSYESIITEFRLENGVTLNGEVTPLIGYTEETVESIKKDIQRLKPEIVGKDIQLVKENLLKIDDINLMFTLSSILPPLETYINSKTKDNIAIDRKDIVYAYSYTNKSVSDITNDMNNIIKSGYNTIKVKVGKNIDEELELIEKLSKADLQNILIRFDANSGYNYEESYKFLSALDKISQNTQYLEQPMCRKCWDEMKLLNDENLNIPIMIDESIYSKLDIQKAHDIGARFIKLKLCKFGSFTKLQEALEFALSLNLKVIFGNGVATDIANFYEAIFYLHNRSKIFGTTEGVGFLKTTNKLLYNITIKD